MKKFIPPDYPIYQSIAKRWSPRKFKTDSISITDLNTIFEAARFSASCYNEQPWRFYPAKKGTNRFNLILESLVEFN